MYLVPLMERLLHNDFLDSEIWNYIVISFSARLLKGKSKNLKFHVRSNIKYTLFFYKNLFYKNAEVEISQNFKRTC